MRVVIEDGELVISNGSRLEIEDLTTRLQKAVIAAVPRMVPGEPVELRVKLGGQPKPATPKARPVTPPRVVTMSPFFAEPADADESTD